MRRGSPAQSRRTRKPRGLPSRIATPAAAGYFRKYCIRLRMNAIQPKIGEPVSDELALVQAAKKGDVSAFEELVKRYDRNVFRIAQHITQNREDAEDVVQDAFLKAYSNLEQFQGQSKFYTWLVRI